jgi:preprotein translocase subunit SecB
MADEQQPEAAAAQQPAAGGQLAIQRVYIKDLSFEAPNSPAVFMQQIEPDADVYYSNTANKLGDDTWEVVLQVTVTVKAEDRTVYLVEIQQAGIFIVRGFQDAQIQAILATACPNALYPFARQAICDVVVKGGFPQLLLAPVNFEMIYAQELQRRAQAQAEGAAAGNGEAAGEGTGAPN